MKDVVKITPRGKVSIALNASLKVFLKNLLELFMNDQPRPKELNTKTCQCRTYLFLVNEVYVKYLVVLSMTSQGSKITLTMSQAHAIWYLAQEYDQFSYSNPEMGGLLLQLHQQLS